MKILVLNGSPRKGNTVTAINSFIEGVNGRHEVEVVDTYKLKVSPCMACGACGCTNGCVANDDSNMIAEKVVEADMIVFATPVYWWGITAQIKMVLDKLYCMAVKMSEKKAAVIAVGGDLTDSVQYQLIKTQFECIADYMKWDILFHKSYSASEKDDLAKDEVALAELKAEGEKL